MYLTARDHLFRAVLQNRHKVKFPVHSQHDFRWIAGLGVLVVLCIVIAVARTVTFVPALVISSDKGTVLRRIPLEEGTFIHHFIHSVHKTPVDEYFEVHGTSLDLTEVRFDTYGVGMPSDEGEGFSLRDGRFSVKLHRSFSRLPIRVSFLPDHGIIAGGRLLAFSEMVPSESAIILSAGRIPIFRLGRISPK